MEADIIVEGFKNSVAMHGLKYAKLIGKVFLIFLPLRARNIYFKIILGIEMRIKLLQLVFTFKVMVTAVS